MKIDLIHRNEWIVGSGISASITDLNLVSLWKNEPIAAKLGRTYLHSPGWWCGSLELPSNQPSKTWGQFKPNTPEPNYETPGGKAKKYLTPSKKSGDYDAFVLKIAYRDWQKIAANYSDCTLPDGVADKFVETPDDWAWEFWHWVKASRTIPLIYTEGCKKAAAILTCGYVGIGLAGVEMGLIGGKVVATTKYFAESQRAFVWAFDADIVVKKEVGEALQRQVNPLLRLGCSIAIAQWDLSEGKGIDDLLVNKGENRIFDVLRDSIAYKHWSMPGQKFAEPVAKKIEETDDEDELEDFGENTNSVLAAYNKIYQKFGAKFKRNDLNKSIEFEGKTFDIEQARLFLAKKLNLKVNKGDAIDIIVEIAEKNHYNPVCDYLKANAEKHDGSFDISNLSSRYLGTDNPLYDRYIKMFLISCVARVFEPGCKLDTVLVLQGAQGIYKSTFFNSLAGKDWFDSSMGDASDKDELLKAHRAWITEWAELETITTKKQESQVKSFLSNQIDRVRLPYGRSVVDLHRGFVIVGSTNRTDFLNDSTGDRRFWVIPTAISEVNVKQLEQERDLIWAAAVVAYNNKERWWLTKEEQGLSSESNEAFKSEHPWQEPIAKFLDNQFEVTLSQILTHLKSDVGTHTKSDERAIADCLQHLQWAKAGRKYLSGRAGPRVNIWKKVSVTSASTAQTSIDLESQSHLNSNNSNGFQTVDHVDQAKSNSVEFSSDQNSAQNSYVDNVNTTDITNIDSLHSLQGSKDIYSKDLSVDHTVDHASRPQNGLVSEQLDPDLASRIEGGEGI